MAGVLDRPHSTRQRAERPGLWFIFWSSQVYTPRTLEKTIEITGGPAPSVNEYQTNKRMRSAAKTYSLLHSLTG